MARQASAPDSTTEDTLRALAKTYMGDDPAHDLAHVQRVVANAKTIAADEPPGTVTPELAAAGWLHDIVAFEKDRADRANAGSAAAELAGQLLRQRDWAKTLDVAVVQDAIVDHGFSAGRTPRTREGRILQDADRLDAIGAIGIARCFSVGARLGARFHHPDDAFAEGRALDDGAYSLDHFQTKLFHLEAGMNTAAGRRLAEGRTAFLRAFFARFAAEIDGRS